MKGTWKESPLDAVYRWLHTRILAAGSRGSPCVERGVLLRWGLIIAPVTGMTSQLHPMLPPRRRALWMSVRFKKIIKFKKTDVPGFPYDARNHPWAIGRAPMVFFVFLSLSYNLQNKAVGEQHWDFLSLIKDCCQERRQHCHHRSNHPPK